MITLEEACKIAKRGLETENSFVWNVCVDMGDSWVFGIGWKNCDCPYDLNGVCYIVNKEDGSAWDSVFPVMGEEFNDKWIKAPRIDISEYLSKDYDPEKEAVSRLRRAELYKKWENLPAIDLDEYFSDCKMSELD